ncbi:FtsQ-type POTRA domain-containing protein [Microbacterium sp. A93]|uniref:FtsQ-type POTRA domain-containing protein n=1 Tax=unclassified Microbacterium TaxID=2609290 RepID=UPI003F42DC74
MRRPAPLPTSPEQEEQPAPGRPSRFARFTREAQVEAESVDPRDPVDLHNPGSASAEESADIAAAEPQTLKGLTARDVWRAARARRKTLRAEIRRFTQRSRRRRLIWLGALGAVILLIGGSAAAAYSPLFAVRKVTVVGASALDPATVEAALADQIGTPIALVDDNAVKAALIAFPLIETYSLEANPPHDLTLRIVERTPIGVIESDAGFTLVDAAGVALSTTPDPPAGQPVIDVTGGTKSVAFESVGLVVRSLPAEVRTTLSSVQASTQDDVTLTLSSGVVVVWGSAERSRDKAVALASVMTANPGAHTFDVSSPEVAVAG